MSTAKRQTQQRMAILAAIEATDCTFTPKELLNLAQSHCPGLGIATVYRSISDLVEDGVIRRVVVAGGTPRYERTNVKHHHHFHCESCGGVAPLEGCPIRDSYRLPSGYKVTTHEVTFTGICPECAGSAGRLDVTASS